VKLRFVPTETTQIDLRIDSAPSLRVGITFDTREDFGFVAAEPDDWDAEFAVSTAVDDIAHALEDIGHTVSFIGSGRKLLDNFRNVENSVDIVFNIAEGFFGRGREAQIPALLELAGIPFVGSDCYTLALALNKWHTKLLARSYGVTTPNFQIATGFAELGTFKHLKFPVIAKPCYEGSSKGLRSNSVSNNPSHLERTVQYLLRTYRQPVLVEEFIQGKEIDVPILGTSPMKAFGVVGITLKGSLDLGNNFLTSEIIRDDAYGFRFPLEEKFVCEAEKSALLIYNLLECLDFGRVDMRIDDKGRPQFLEINPYPFLGKHSSFNEIATKTGLGYKNMIGIMLNSALKRYHKLNKTGRPISGIDAVRLS
jgi:D-alanine-D-alanine ligase